MRNKPTISLCMIVKDEELWLKDCLRSVSSICSESIVVDTGSTDATVTIAEQHGCKVIAFPWGDDFAAARNESLRHASGEWILILDADERFVQEDASLLLQLLTEEGHSQEGWFLQVQQMLIRSHEQEPSVMNVNPLLRLFRNKPQYRFEGTIHEQIAACILREQPSASFGISPCRIQHLGYQPSVVQAKGKIARNIELLERIIAREGRQPFHLFNLAVERLRQGEALEAQLLLREGRDITPITATFAPLMIKYEALACALLGHFEDAIQLCTAGLAVFPEYTDLAFAQSNYHYSIGQRIEAHRLMYKVLEMGPPPAHYHTEAGIATFRAALQLAAWSLQEHAWGNADTAYRLALRDAACPSDSWLSAIRLRQIINLVPQQCEEGATWLSAHSIEQQSKLQRALAYIGTTATCSSSTTTSSHLDLHELYSTLHYLHQADATLARMQRISPSHHPAVSARASLPLATLSLQLANTESEP